MCVCVCVRVCVLCRINNLDGSAAGEDTGRTWLKLLAAAPEIDVNLRKVTSCRRRREDGFFQHYTQIDEKCGFNWSEDCVLDVNYDMSCCCVCVCVCVCVSVCLCVLL